MADFLHMGGYAFYVWGSYLLVTILLAWFYFAPRVRLRQLHNELAGEMTDDRDLNINPVVTDNATGGGRKK